MNRTVLIIIGVVIVLVVGVGAVLFFASQQAAPAPTPTPIATAQVQAQLKLTAAPPSGTLAASSSASFDLLLNTNGVKIDGFQFIANLDGAGAIVSDSDPNAAGTQIGAATVTGLNPVTNSVVAQGTTQVIRFAMITQNAATPFSSTSPVKVASVTFTPTTAGTVTLSFNTQNTRANRTGTTADTLISADSQTFVIGPTIAQAASPSAALAAAPTGTTGATAVSCDAACLTDSDCSIGLSCINNSCRNPANPTSLTCSAASRATGSAVLAASPSPTPRTQATTSATPKPTVTPRPTATPRPTITPKVASIAALPSALPQSGAVENTIYLISVGVACMVLAAVLMLRTL